MAGESNKWFHFKLQVYGSEGQINVSLNQSLQLIAYVSGERKVESSSWDRDSLQALVEYLDSVALYAANPSQGQLPILIMPVSLLRSLWPYINRGYMEGKSLFPHGSPMT